jgi:hypothetical protein
MFGASASRRRLQRQQEEWTSGVDSPGSGWSTGSSASTDGSQWSAGPGADGSRWSAGPGADGSQSSSSAGADGSALGPVGIGLSDGSADQDGDGALAAVTDLIQQAAPALGGPISAGPLLDPAGSSSSVDAVAQGVGSASLFGPDGPEKCEGNPDPNCLVDVCNHNADSFKANCDDLATVGAGAPAIALSCAGLGPIGASIALVLKIARGRLCAEGTRNLRETCKQMKRT